MKEQFEKEIQHWIDMGWITVNNHLDQRHLSHLLCESVKKMPVGEFISQFAPRDIL